MLSKKSFLANERNVLAPLVRPTRGNVRDHIIFDFFDSIDQNAK
jgi:hypothetical protein